MSNTTSYYSLTDALIGLELLSEVGEVVSEDDLCSLILHNHARVKGADETDLPSNHRLPGLRAALQCLRNKHGIHNPIQGLLPCILQQAQELNRLFPEGHIPTLPRGRAKSISLSAAQVLCLLANAALCNLGRIPLPELTSEQKQSLRETMPHYGSLSPYLWYQSETRVACERTSALWLYLHAATDRTRGVDVDRIITFQRATKLPPLPKTSTRPKISVDFVHQQGIEAVKMSPTKHDFHARMDFANATLHVGALWPTATQEEILFSAYPECLVGVLFCETMASTDAIIISNVKRYIVSTGFAERYRVEGLVPQDSSSPRDEKACIVAVDASIPETLAEQLQPSLINRDVSKAAIAWTASAKDTIVTGNWGSGAFGGNIYAKFLHQYLAACRCSIHQRGTLQLIYCLVGTNNAIEEQNMRHLEEWVSVVYAQGGEAAVVSKLEALTRDGNEQDDWSLQERLLQLPAKFTH